MRILFDADAYIALYSKNDALHEKAKKILFSLDEDDKHFVTWDVIDEVATKLSYYISKGAAKKFLDDIERSETTIIFMEEEIADDVVDKFRSIKSKKVSLTDVFNMVAYVVYDIDVMFSFDGIYQKNKLKVLI